ncbi:MULTISPECIES: hypothetical protein [Hydrocarboniphaga]|jgi:hypothetical protein|uniref:Uncharacterized protein n=1 Tax=Hydrocarboniphaga effusa AP103 TaxID=1172194 RepID=I8T7A6_9GAMM|nr:MULTISPECIES: hypothetical protein [Hydrocarboniphaga]EIT69618.1 hypothetical protein WQQ_32000 [Hydrocarboniphaga effusa AP103]MDZ4080071.1 hypothetical protein [Hydrocarboniphaga sp.]
MRLAASLPGLLFACVSFVSTAAVVPQEAIGKWVEKGDAGSIGWEFAAEQIIISPADAAGAPQGEASKLDVLYQAHNGGWIIVLRSPESGAPIGEGAMQLVKDGSLLVMLPGIGEHQLQRAGAAAKPKAKQ